MAKSRRKDKDASSAPAGSGSQISTPGKTVQIVAVMAAYWGVSISMVFLNKYLLSSDDVKLGAPFFVTWYQCFIAVIVCFVLRFMRRVVPTLPDFDFSVQTALKVLPLSLVFIGMVTLNNLCLKYVGVMFYNVGRGLTPLFNMLLGYFALRDYVTYSQMMCALMIVVGFTTGCWQEDLSGGLSITGVGFGVLSSFFVSLYSVVMKMTLKHVNNNTWHLILYNNTNAVFLLLPILYGFGEVNTVMNYEYLGSGRFWSIMTVTSVCGMGVGYLIGLNIRLTSPLTHNISATAKAISQTIIATIVQQNSKSGLWWFANLLVVVMSALYGQLRRTQQKPAAQIAAEEEEAKREAAEAKETEKNGRLKQSASSTLFQSGILISFAIAMLISTQFLLFQQLRPSVKMAVHQPQQHRHGAPPVVGRPEGWSDVRNAAQSSAQASEEEVVEVSSEDTDVTHSIPHQVSDMPDGSDKVEENEHAIKPTAGVDAEAPSHKFKQCHPRSGNIDWLADAIVKAKKAPPGHAGCRVPDCRSADALASYGYEASKGKDAEYVLVLGSGGLVGTALVSHLKEKGYNVLEVRGRNHMDLRDKCALDMFRDIKISFVYFLACEVGGAKFMQQPGAQKKIWDSNEVMHNNVFAWLKKRQIRFVFSSSQLVNKPTNYGKVKKLAEDIILEKMPLGRIVRFWNIFGMEPLGIKAHVITDIVVTCLRKGKKRVMTTGYEKRQFLHTDDCSAGLTAMMTDFDALEPVTHLSHGKWSSIREVAAVVEKKVPGGCKVEFQEDVKPQYAIGTEPDLDNKFHKEVWKAKLSLEEGVTRVVDDFAAMQEDRQERACPYLSLVVVGRNDGYGGQMYLDKFNNLVANFYYFSDLYDVSAELIIVDYSPVDAKSTMLKSLHWPSTKGMRRRSHPRVRIITVPQRLHKAHPLSAKLPFLEYVGKNAGIRRAHGQFVLTLNSDNLISDDMWQFFSREQLEHSFFYQVGRMNGLRLPPKETSNPEALLDWMIRNSKSHSPTSRKRQYVCGRKNYVHKIPQWNQCSGRSPSFSDKFPQLYTSAPGDFILAHRDLWEDTWAHTEQYARFRVDTVMICSLAARGGGQGGTTSVLMDQTVYHQWHERPKSHSASKTGSPPTKTCPTIACKGTRAAGIATHSWGFKGSKLEVDLVE